MPAPTTQSRLGLSNQDIVSIVEAEVRSILGNVKVGEELPLLEVELGLLPSGQLMNQLKEMLNVFLLRTFLFDYPIEMRAAPHA